MRYKTLAVACLGLALSVPAAALDFGLPALTKEQKVKAVNLGGMAFITAWGVAKWDYFKRSPNAQSEGWFGRGTDEGGSDKFGHLWSAYAMADGLASVYQDWGFSEDAAALNGALSSFAIMGYMELGDSFSRYGFSYEDMVMNTVGSLASWYFHKYPSLADKIDLRWEYAPAFDEPDFFTDYEHSKYLIALELDGFDALRGSPLQYLELHLGYYARGFDERLPDRDNTVYAGVGINLGKIFSNMGCGSFCSLFHYYQPPYTYISAED